jgi:alkylation response protein AidB-like acyl-CoA dehydrogenase
MDFRDTPGERAWRSTVRGFLDSEAPAEYRGPARRLAGAGGAGDDLFAAWRAKVAARGWLAAHWPKQYGGAGLSVMEQFVMKEEFAVQRIPHPGGGRAVDMVGPTVILHGSDAQKQELLPPILAGQHVYCQGFSEPGAGSDLAAIQLRAVRDGDDYVLDGQKIWTSNATTCNWMFMLARTDPAAPKHRGISYFVLPMSSPGLEVRTMKDMAGGYDLCETFFDNVRVPARYRIGEENQGWYVAMTTLDFERSGIGGTIGLQHSLLDMLQYLPRLRPADPRRLELADLYVATEVCRQVSYQVVSMQNRGLVPNHQASMVKLLTGGLTQRIASIGMRCLGLEGALLAYQGDPAAGRTARSYLGAVPNTIWGGTSEVQRNIIATRGLGLPR